jgi:hypothetical protein
MKKLSILILLFLSGSVVLAQTAYYEAKTLKAILGDTIANYEYPPQMECAADSTKSACTNYAVVLSILRKYAPENIKNSTNKAVIEYYRNNNPFFSDLPELTHEVSGAKKSGLGGLFSSAISSIGGIDVTTFADGLAQFLVERTKEELNVAFFEKLKRLLEQYPEFAVLFPNTQVFLNNFESWQYANLITSMREAFNKDLNAVLSNLVALRNLKESSCPDKSTSCKNRVNELVKFFHTNEGRVMLAAFQFGNTLQGGQKIPDAISSIASQDFLLGYTHADSNVQRDFRNGIKLLNIVNLSLRSVETSRNYITKTEFQALTKDQTLQRLFLGLFYQQMLTEDLKFTRDDVAVTSILQRMNNLSYYFSLVLEEQEKLDAALDSLKKKRLSDKATPEDYVAVFDASNVLLRTMLNFQVIDSRIPQSPELEKFFSATTSVSEIAHDITAKNYHAAIISILKLFDDQVKQQSTPNPAMDDFKSSFLNYASFGANVVKAESSEDVKKAIKAVALPAGSSSIKKTTDFNIALNAYVGFVYGEDKPSRDKYTVTDANGDKVEVALNGGRALAVYAPIGVTFSKGMLFSKRNPWSISAFISVIDIGGTCRLSVHLGFNKYR